METNRPPHSFASSSDSENSTTIIQSSSVQYQHITMRSMMFLSFAGLASLQSSCRAFVSRQSTIVHSGVVASNRLFSSTTVNDVDTSSRLLSPPSIVLQKVFEEDNRPIILFDGTCRRLCTRMSISNHILYSSTASIRQVYVTCAILQ